MMQAFLWISVMKPACEREALDRLKGRGLLA